MSNTGQSAAVQTAASAESIDRPVLALSAVAKSYGPTRALRDAHITVAPGEIVGLMGHNGAGKTTLVKIISGILAADSGTIEMSGDRMSARYGVREARRHGVALALQEISLCADLRLEENVALASPEIVRRGWRRRARVLIMERLDEMFPHHGIAPRVRVETLSLAQRQMLQIALASLSSGSEARLLILDEPTSALPEEFAESLFEYLHRAKRATGLAMLLVSHKMADILRHTDRTVVMRDGAVVDEHVTPGLTTDRILQSMGAAEAVTQATRGIRRTTVGGDGYEVVQMSDVRWRGLHDVSLSVRCGEIVGVAGLEGNGQRDVLDAVWRSRGRHGLHRGLRHAVKVAGRIGYVSGDRQIEGIFPLWGVRENLTISLLRRMRRMGSLSMRTERAETERWIERMAIKASAGTRITSLSGGNQQKVLLARSLALEPDLLMLDDPFRGVDITTKLDAYELLREEAARGRAVLWYTTENSELLECDIVYVLRSGRVAAVLSGDDLTVDKIIAASFDEGAEAGRQS